MNGAVLDMLTYAIHRGELIGSVGEKRFKEEEIVNRMNKRPDFKEGVLMVRGWKIGESHGVNGILECGE